MKRMITIAAALMLLAAAGACEKYEDGRPSKDVRTEFARMYPDAWDVEYCQTPTVNFYRFDIRYGGREIEVDVTEGGEVTPADYGF